MRLTILVVTQLGRTERSDTRTFSFLVWATLASTRWASGRANILNTALLLTAPHRSCYRTPRRVKVARAVDGENRAGLRGANGVSRHGSGVVRRCLCLWRTHI